jgi:GNAT superfamily N-acetyltransferase
MIEIETITTQSVMIYKDLLLRALQEAPTAFGSTYLSESRLTDADWHNRVRNSNGQDSIFYFAVYCGFAVGLAGGYLDEQSRQKAHLVSMWTASTHWKRGIGRLLVKTICEWATSARRQSLTAHGYEHQ